MKDNKEVIVYYVEDDKINYKEFFTLLVKKKKLFILITAAVTLFAITYTMFATKWWQVSATFEIGKYIDEKTGEKIYIEKGKVVSERLKVVNIESYQYIKDRDRSVKITSIASSKKNPELITIIAMGKNTDIALLKIQKIVNKLRNKHKIIMNEVYEKGMMNIEQINREIYKLNNKYIKQTLEEINEIRQIQVSLLNKKIKTLVKNIQKATTSKEDIINKWNLLNSKASHSALPIIQLKIEEDRISTNNLKIIDIEQGKETLINNRLIELERKISIFKKIDLETLKEQKSLILMKFKSNNFYNTEIVGKIVTQKKPIKPKKIFIIIFAFILGTILSSITILFMNMKKA